MFHSYKVLVGKNRNPKIMASIERIIGLADELIAGEGGEEE